MESDNVKSSAEVADEARQVGRDAAQAAQGYVSVARQIGGDALQAVAPSLEDAKAATREARDTVSGLAGDVHDVVADAAATSRVYAKDAMDAAGRKVTELKGQARQFQENCNRYVGREPVKAALISAAGGALAMAFVLSMSRSHRRYD